MKKKKTQKLLSTPPCENITRFNFCFCCFFLFVVVAVRSYSFDFSLLKLPPNIYINLMEKTLYSVGCMRCLEEKRNWNLHLDTRWWWLSFLLMMIKKMLNRSKRYFCCLNRRGTKIKKKHSIFDFFNFFFGFRKTNWLIDWWLARGN